MFPAPIPPGWIKLQERARCAKNADELSRIIDEMNELLDEYQAKRGNNEQAPNASVADAGQPEE